MIIILHTWIIHRKTYSECPCAQLSARGTLKNSAFIFIELTCLVGEPRQYKELANCEVSCPLLRNYFAYRQHQTMYQFTFLPYNLCRGYMCQHCPVNEILSDPGSDFKVCFGIFEIAVPWFESLSTYWPQEQSQWAQVQTVTSLVRDLEENLPRPHEH